MNIDKAPEVVFFDKLVASISQEIVKTNGLAVRVAAELENNPDLIKGALEKLDPHIISNCLVKQLLFMADHNSNDHALSTYKKIMKEAQALSIKLVAQRLADETMGA